MTKDEALKLALEVLEEINQLSIGENAVCLPAEIDTAMDAIKEALAQPEQEPVAWFCSAKQLVEIKRPTEDDYRFHLGNWEPLYTYPPQRKPMEWWWIDELAKRKPNWTMIDFARAIEAAHGIKGEA